jgi:transcriptional regulator with XRE-family HTH domain
MSTPTLDMGYRIRELVRSGEARRLWESAGLSLRVMARAMGDCDPMALSRWERGICQPTGRRVRDYCRALDRLAALDAQAGGENASP